MAGNLMKYYEQQILDLTEEERNEIALQCIRDMISDGEGGFWLKDNQAITALVLVGAKLGIGGDRPLNRYERRLAKYVAETAFTDLTEETVSDMINAMPVGAYDYAEVFAKLGGERAMAYFRYILCWALADGVIEAALEARLESIFGLLLIVDFADSGLESVPAPKIQLTGLEAEIAHKLKQEDDLYRLRDIQARFPNRSGSEVEGALDSLCQKGVLYCVDTAVGNMYGLENENWIEVSEPRSAAAKEADSTPAKPSSGYQSAYHAELEAQKKAIIAQMEPGRRYTVTEMIRELPACCTMTNQRASAVANSLSKKGLLKQEKIGGKTYYRLP